MTTNALLVEEALTAFMSPERVSASASWAEIARLCAPSQSALFGSSALPASGFMPNLLTNVGILSAQKLSSSLVSILMNEAESWVQVTFRDESFLDDEEASNWSGFVSRTLLANLSDSNFYSEALKFWHSLSCFGTAVMVADEINAAGSYEGLNFRTLHLSQCAWYEGRTGLVERVYIKESLTLEVVLSRYGKMSSDSKKRLTENPTERLNVVTCNIPESDGSFLVSALECTSGFILDVRRTNVQSVLVARWLTSTGESIGWGCGHTASYDVSILNNMRFEHLQALALVNRPPVMVEQDNILGELQVKSGHIVNVASLEGIAPMNLGINTHSALVSEADLKESIRSAFLLDNLTLPPRTETGEMSALEVSRRVSEMSRATAGVNLRIFSEFLAPLGGRVLDILYRNNQLGIIPKVLSRSGELNVHLKFKFINQLSRAQGYEGVQALQNALQLLLPLAQSNPAVMLVFDEQELPLKACRDIGVPEIYISSKDELIKKQKAFTEMQKAQKEAELLASLQGSVGNEANPV